MKRITLMMALVVSLGLAACADGRTVPGFNNVGTKQAVGTAGGAVVGGLLGSKVGGGSGQLWATGAGALLGALVGSEIGQSLDRADRQYLASANSRALDAPVGQQISWENPQSGNYGYVTPTRNGTDTAGRYCREYQQTIYVGGRQETGYGTACQSQDGTWEVVS
jgi:surface antigen